MASSRSSWNCIHTVWYESQAGDANHWRLPASSCVSASSKPRLVAGEPGNLGHEVVEDADRRRECTTAQAADDPIVVRGVGVVVGDPAASDLPVVAHLQQPFVEPAWKPA